MHGDSGVARTRASADHCDTGSASQPGVGQGQETRTVFVAADDCVDISSTVKGVEQTQIAFPRYAEDAIDLMCDECFDDEETNGRHARDFPDCQN